MSILAFHVDRGRWADRLAQGELTEAEGDALLKAVRTLASTKLVLVEDGLPPSLDSAGQAGNAAYVILD